MITFLFGQAEQNCRLYATHREEQFNQESSFYIQRNEDGKVFNVLQNPFLLILLAGLAFQGGKDIDQEIEGEVAFLNFTLMLLIFTQPLE